MYTNFFGLHEKPFAITPDPRYLFLSERHAEGLAHLLYGVTESGGFIQLTGEVGTGKTTIVRSLLEQLPDETDVALVLNPKMTPHEFLLSICEELHVPLLPDERRSIKAIIDALNRRLLHAHADGRRVVLIVDEAQNLSPDVLEQIRLLTNLETAKQKLLQIILIGQPELRELLSRNDLRQLAQRVTGRYHLEPLSAEETRAYIGHRIQVAGGRAEIFTRSATSVVHRSAGGIPRLVNVICDRALLGAYSRERGSVTKGLAKRAVREVSGGQRSNGFWRWLAGAAGIVALAAIVLGAWNTAPAPPGPNSASPNDVEPVPVPVPAVSAVQQRTPQPVASTEVDHRPVREPEEAIAEATIDQSPPPSLSDSLSAISAATDTDSSFDTLLSLWRVQLPPGTGQPCEAIQAEGLRCLYEQGSWRQLINLDRPAIIALTDRTGANHQVVLGGLKRDGTAILLAGQNRLEASLDQLIPLWNGEYLVVWRPAQGPGRTLTEGAFGADVLWLRQSLARLAQAPIPSDRPEFFDTGLTEAVRNFQTSRQMRSDGIAGARTMIAVNTALGLPGRHLLEQEG